MGFGASVIAKLLTTSIRKNLFYTIKDKVVEERITGSAIHKRMQKTKIYGSDSTKDEREQLMEILRERVEYHKDKIISPTIYEELCGLEVKRNGKIEHSSNTHDDQIFSWLWALYIYYCGGDLMNNWGISKRVLKTDADLEEAVVDIHEDSKELVDEIDVLDNEEINEQIDTLNNAPGKMLYEDWIKSETAKDDAAMNKLLSDKAVQKSLGERYHIVVNQASQTTQSIPNEVFMKFNQDPEEEMYANTTYAGNMSKFW